jgi:HSP20 family protein
MTKKSGSLDTAVKGKEVEVTRAGEPTQGTWLTPFDELDRIFDAVFPRGWLRPFHFDWPMMRELHVPFEGKMPRVDVIERDDEILVRAELPGVSRDDIEVTLTEHSLTLNAVTKREEEEERGDFRRHEITRGEFHRTVALPENVDAEQTKARFENGLLEVTLPKAEPSKRRTVKVE